MDDGSPIYCGVHQFTFDANKDRTQIEACEHFMIGARNAGVGQRTGGGRDDGLQG